MTCAGPLSCSTQIARLVHISTSFELKTYNLDLSWFRMSWISPYITDCLHVNVWSRYFLGEERHVNFPGNLTPCVFELRKVLHTFQAQDVASLLSLVTASPSYGVSLEIVMESILK